METPKNWERGDCSAIKGKDVKDKQSQEPKVERVANSKKKLFGVI